MTQADTNLELSVNLPDAEATAKLGAAIGELIEEGTTIALTGSLGAGKTTLVQGLASAMQVSEVVNSPTFTMLNEYHSGNQALYHLDLYRFEENTGGDPKFGGQSVDTLLMELDEIRRFGGITIIEWANYCLDTVPLDHVLIDITYEGPGRLAKISAQGQKSSTLVRKLIAKYKS